jgi:hypothetical protein
MSFQQFVHPAKERLFDSVSGDAGRQGLQTERVLQGVEFGRSLLFSMDR